MLINEAAEALYLRVASAEDLELAMTTGVNYPKGLLAWADELAGKLGDIITVEAREESLKHKVGVYQVRVVNQNGVVLALFKGTAYRTSNEIFGLSAGIAAARAIQSGDGDLFVAGGVENMTRAPFVMSKPSKAFGSDSQMHDSSFGWRFINSELQVKYGTDAMGETAENLVDQYYISRDDQDAFALASQQKAAAAQQRGRFAQELAPVCIPQRKGEPMLFAEDEFIKPDTTLDGLAKLRPAFRKTGTVTAGNASGLNDGAAALLLASEDGIKQHNLTPKARIVSMGVAGVEPRIMGIGPVPATQQALKKAGLTLNDIDIIELN
nr:3-ketoacyl-CoA thiolase 2, peroxisomal-like [Tanacetum cinerariifolium]